MTGANHLAKGTQSAQFGALPPGMAGNPSAAPNGGSACVLPVAEAPRKAYNPLFVYGDSGLGKTHLLHAIGHYAQTLYSGLKVRYVSSEEFTNDFINMIRDGKQDGFRRRYRDVDVLLVDDIQFLENKEGTQEEFFHTFNTLHNASKQIVISSDRAPKRLVTLEDRLRSRFEWGLLTDVQPPELETRIAILRRKAIQDRARYSASDCRSASLRDRPSSSNGWLVAGGSRVEVLVKEVSSGGAGASCSSRRDMCISGRAAPASRLISWRTSCRMLTRRAIMTQGIG